MNMDKTDFLTSKAMRLHVIIDEWDIEKSMKYNEDMIKKEKNNMIG